MLGSKGLFWLKVQLANLYGFDKASFSERANWTEEHMMQVYDSAQKPLDGDRWWSNAENPWQVKTFMDNKMQLNFQNTLSSVFTRHFRLLLFVKNSSEHMKVGARNKKRACETLRQQNYHHEG